jgi:hypothetical protein
MMREGKEAGGISWRVEIGIRIPLRYPGSIPVRKCR